MFGIKSNRWKDDDEYKRARWAYEGQGTAATKAAWFLGVGLIAMTGIAISLKHDNTQLASLGDLKFVGIETNRTTGEVVTVSSFDGKLVVDETKRRQFIRYWIGLWRAVPADAVVYNANYQNAQVYMADAVFDRVNDYMTVNPIDQFIKSGNARMIRVENVTPSGNGVRYRVDWVESVYQKSVLVSQVKMTADLDLEQHTPKTDIEAEANIFGLVVKGFYWTPAPNA